MMKTTKPMGKEKTDRSATFASGGGKKMAGKSGAAAAQPGKVSSGGRSAGNGFAKGGGSRMAGKSGAMPAKPM